MTSLHDDLRHHLGAILDGIETEPRMYGAAESAEMQYLLLLELLQFVMQPTRSKANLRQVRDAYDGFLRRHFPEDGPHYLAGLLDAHGESARLATLLREFRREFEGELRPENE